MVYGIQKGGSVGGRRLRKSCNSSTIVWAVRVEGGGAIKED